VARGGSFELKYFDFVHLVVPLDHRPEIGNQEEVDQEEEET